MSVEHEILMLRTIRVRPPGSRCHCETQHLSGIYSRTGGACECRRLFASGDISSVGIEAAGPLQQGNDYALIYKRDEAGPVVAAAIALTPNEYVGHRRPVRHLRVTSVKLLFVQAQGTGC